jgi:hypothetical protein
MVLASGRRGALLPIWLKSYATGRKVAGSISDEVITLFFNSPNHSSRTIALELDSASNRNEYH